MDDTRYIIVNCCDECGFNENGEGEYCFGLPKKGMSRPLIELMDIDTLNEIHPECPLPKLIKHDRGLQ